MFDASTEISADHRTQRFRIASNGQPFSYSLALDALQTEAPFREFLTGLLANSPFAAFRWETPPITSDARSRCFEFVVLDAPEFVSRASDRQAFSEYFGQDRSHPGVVVFENLRKDATLVVPTPHGSDSVYGHLAAFVREAPSRQVDTFWQVVGRTVEQQLSARPLWLSTAGGGVAWLHVRLDSHPKYYQFKPFRTFA